MMFTGICNQLVDGQIKTTIFSDLETDAYILVKLSKIQLGENHQEKPFILIGEEYLDKREDLTQSELYDKAIKSIKCEISIEEELLAEEQKIVAAWENIRDNYDETNELHVRSKQNAKDAVRHEIPTILKKLDELRDGLSFVSNQLGL